ncbi:MAG: DNA polymerase III subunit alpha, partial [bacterium]
MEALFDPAIIRNTVEVIDFCNAHIPTKVKYLPDFPLPQGIQKSDYLKQLCIVGIKKRFQGSRVPSSYQQRLLHELTLIHQMGFDDYFLIVWDYVRYAKVHGIFVGPGRGSAAGSLVAYALGITNVDPIKYDLIFERFLNPERVSLPDIDIDFQDDRRDEVVDYVIQKYGHEHAAQIVTFTTYGPRNAIKDIGKVMSLPLPRLEMIAKMVPTNPKSKKTITQMYQTSASFQSLVNEQAVMRRLIGPMSVIEHLPRNISKHAAGVVLSGQPLKRIVPLVVGPSSSVMTQYSKNYIEEAGFLKMDFLGLKNLTMIAYICHDLEEKEHIRLNINTLDLNDQPTYHLLSQGDTYGVFQLESAGMRQLLRRMKPSCFDDIVAAIALYRPGPMENIPLYLKGRAEGAFEPLLPELKDILKPTYGIIIYQEQIMQIAQIVGGFSFSKADILRQGISKKKGELISQLREEFLSGARAKGIDEGKAEEIFDMIEKFGDYGFNKSHSVAYGLVAYQLAYLKTHYPLYFFASILSNEGSSTATKIHVIEESRKHGVKILPPSINYSYDRFIVEGHSIRYALLAVKNVGLAIYQTIAKEREKGLFKDMYDFLSRIASRLSAKTIESLIDAGAFDEFNPNRAFLKGNLATMSEYAYLSDSLGLDEPPVLRNVRENQYQRLENEKEALGLYLTTHPLRMVKDQLKIPVVDLINVERYINKTIHVLINVSRIRVIVDKRGQEMAFIEGRDDTGQCDCVCFSSQYSRYRQVLERGETLILEVKVQSKDRITLLINSVEVYDERTSAHRW